MENIKSVKKVNKGTTIVEMTVTFALLAIFMTSAAMIITSVTNLYYQVKGETFANQVTDIIMEKAESEIDGAKYYPIGTDDGIELGLNSEGASYIDLYNKTDTHVKIYSEDGELLIYYYPIINTVDTSKSRNETIWRFDKKAYDGFEVEELYFVRGNEIGTVRSKANEYGIPDSCQFDSNIIIVFLKLDSPKYGTYKTYKAIKMMNIPTS